MRFALALLFVLLSMHFAVSQNVESFGIFAGINAPFTLDKGFQKDPRYYGELTVRSTPFGFNYGMDYMGYGFLISPSYTKIGQKFIIQNTSGGHAGTRDITMNYFSVPISLKLHVNDISFFRLSLVASLNINFLLEGKETQNFVAAKLKYPAKVSVPTSPGYVVSYDGVFVPAVIDEIYVSKDKFKPIQLFAGIGFRSDFDLNDNWSFNFDGRANFGIFESRKSSYLQQLQNPSGPPDINGSPGAPDLYGIRRDVYISISVGFSRIVVTKKEFKPKRTTVSPATATPAKSKRHTKKPLSKKKRN
ncbi:MAG: outer membrane beta-barrel protein [Bacteroidia bacterium]|nr:outer membrane beta-barrel protein [Bacteroidia bacterium]